MAQEQKSAAKSVDVYCAEEKEKQAKIWRSMKRIPKLTEVDKQDMYFNYLMEAHNRFVMDNKISYFSILGAISAFLYYWMKKSEED